MNRIFDGIDWMLQHHPIISIILILLFVGNVDNIVNFVVPPP